MAWHGMAWYGMVWYGIACTCVSPIFWNEVIVIALANWQSDAAGSCHKSATDRWTTRHGQHDKADPLASHWTLIFLGVSPKSNCDSTVDSKRF